MRVAGWFRFNAWAATASESDRRLAYDALFAVCDGTWPEAYALHHEDLVRPGLVHMLIAPHLVLSWRTFHAHPDLVQVVYVGPVDGEH